MVKYHCSTIPRRRFFLWSFLNRHKKSTFYSFRDEQEEIEIGWELRQGNFDPKNFAYDNQALNLSVSDFGKGCQTAVICKRGRSISTIDLCYIVLVWVFEWK